VPSLVHIVPADFPGDPRLDLYVSGTLRLLTRSQIGARALSAKVNGRAAKVSRPVKAGDVLDLRWDEPEPTDLTPEDIPLSVLYEDARAVVIDKPQGLVVHPGAGNRSGTLANALLFRRPSLGGDSVRPGIVHRLDKDTSGAMIAAYDAAALEFLAGQFRNGEARKRYLAIVRGVPRERTGRIRTFLARDPRDRKRFAVSDRGRAALTLYAVVRAWRGHSLVLLRPRTGRTHQLRVHMRHIGHPIVGDPIYGVADPAFPRATLMLHARSLALRLPGGEERVFHAPVPERFREMAARLSAGGNRQ